MFWASHMSELVYRTITGLATLGGSAAMQSKAASIRKLTEKAEVP
jgi:hypothetical protein